MRAFGRYMAHRWRVQTPAQRAWPIAATVIGLALLAGGLANAATYRNGLWVALVWIAAAFAVVAIFAQDQIRSIAQAVREHDRSRR